MKYPNKPRQEISKKHFANSLYTNKYPIHAESRYKRKAFETQNDSFCYPSNYQIATSQRLNKMQFIIYKLFSKIGFSYKNRKSYTYRKDR